MEITIKISDDLVPVLEAFMATQKVQNGVDGEGQPVLVPKYADVSALVQSNLADNLFASLLSSKEFAGASPAIAALQQSVDTAVAALETAKADQIQTTKNPSK